jgi:hypothetical protein
VLSDSEEEKSEKESDQESDEEAEDSDPRPGMGKKAQRRQAKVRQPCKCNGAV